MALSREEKKREEANLKKEKEKQKALERAQKAEEKTKKKKEKEDNQPSILKRTHSLSEKKFKSWFSFDFNRSLSSSKMNSELTEEEKQALINKHLQALNASKSLTPDEVDKFANFRKDIQMNCQISTDKNTDGHCLFLNTPEWEGIKAIENSKLTKESWQFIEDYQQFISDPTIKFSEQMFNKYVSNSNPQNIFTLNIDDNLRTAFPSDSPDIKKHIAYFKTIARQVMELIIDSITQTNQTLSIKNYLKILDAIDYQDKKAAAKPGMRLHK